LAEVTLGDVYPHLGPRGGLRLARAACRV
jgi:hypothetical protein